MTGVIRRGAILRLASFTFLVGFYGGAYAGVDAKTTYDISGSSTRVKTEYKKAPLELDNDFKTKLWERFEAKLKTMPLVTDIQKGQVTETKEDFGSYVNYVTVKRTFPAFIQFSLNKAVTLLVSVEQNTRVCKNPGNVKPIIDETGSGDCGPLYSTLEVKGPISVYGNYESESNLDVADLLRDKQRLFIVASRSYDNADLTLESTLYVDSMTFEKSLLKFFDIFDVSTISKKAEDLTRQSIFLGVARVIRQNNERMLDL